ncbi:helix-turn-helix domain-containing protein [Dactylosporangium roseum]|uniref:Helix-turn-helix domain-containing protein n=1 Tax=Dactylosporangium roseum TaxID=47989 RepID=A0ABY5ZCF6_9ACTN|nr:helix-turn-helix domain-containing protein [Dactylosporangium roseum]UWZ39785.1 helix-turn-helix domain-containing protein [Dactylosporangium roseum]
MPYSASSANGGGEVEPAGKLLTIDAVAELLGVSSRWLADECRAGRIAHVHIARKRRFTAKQVDQLIERFSVQPQQEEPERLHPAVSNRVYRRLQRQGVIPPTRPA